MIVLGLTGSIGMGKTTTAQAFKTRGVPVFDSDLAVHKLLAAGGDAVELVARRFPESLKSRAIDRAALGTAVFADPAALRDLEGILHPLVRRHQSRFLAISARRRLPVVVLDVPLLFETAAERRCDFVAVVSANPVAQARRVLSRAGMTRKKFSSVLERQMPDHEKRKRADFVIRTDRGKRYAFRQVETVLETLSGSTSTVWPPGARGSRRAPR